MIKKLSKGLYYVEVYLGRDKITGKKLRKTKRCKTLKEAKQFEIDTKLGKTKPAKITRPSYTVAEYLDYYFDTYVITRCKLQTQHTYKILIKNINEKIGPVCIHELNQRDIDKMYSDMFRESKTLKNGNIKRRFMNGTILKCHKLLKHALNKAVAWDILVRNPANFATPPGDDKRNIKHWNLEQSTVFLNSVKGSKLYLPTLIALHTGMRCGEICALRWNDINFKQGYLTVNHTLVEHKRKLILQDPKSESSNDRIYLTAFLLDYLMYTFKNRNIIRTDTYICIHEDGRPFRPRYLSVSFRKAVERFLSTNDTYTIPKVTFHGLRHSHATILNDLGATPQEISKRIRHSRISTTFNIYVHLDESLKKKTVNLLNNANF